MKKWSVSYSNEGKQKTMKAIKLKDVKNNAPDSWFTLKPIEDPNEMQVWIKDKDSYDRTTKKYYCTCFGDIGKCRAFDGNKVVYIDFTF